MKGHRWTYIGLFVTGGTGFVGKPTVGRLGEGSHEVRCLVRRSSHTTSELEELGCEPTYGDVSDEASVLEGMRGSEWVVNLANVYSLRELDKGVYRRVNVEGTRNVMEAALEVGVSNVVHLSTLFVWGKPTQRPFDEKTPIGPERVTEYAQSKYEGGLTVWKLYRKKGLPVVVVYPGVVLGADNPKATGQYIRDLIERRIPGKVFEDSPFTYVHVNDVAEAIVRSLQKECNEGEKYLIGKQTFTHGGHTRMVCEISGTSPPKKYRRPSDYGDRSTPNKGGRPEWAAFSGISTDTMRNLKEGAVF